jgi:two-component system sensor histidine kinase KdpD
MCAHDLRGVLTIISGYSALLRRDDLDADERAQALDNIEQAIARADRLLGETLDGKPKPNPPSTVTDLVPLVERAVSAAKAAYGREVRLEVTGKPRAFVEPDALERVMDNLLANAAKYAPEGPIDVRVSWERARDGSPVSVIEVMDRGPGVPSRERESVFAPFARLERDEASPGSGLGLAVVRGVAERVGGRADVFDREGGGAQFRIELPDASGPRE